MQEKGIINTNQFVWMLFIIITSVAALQAPVLFIMKAGREAWLAIIGGWLLDVLLAVVYAYMGIRFPTQNFVQYSITILGKYMGRLVGMVFPMFFLLVGILLQSALAQLLCTVYLEDTPFAVIMITIIIFSSYIALNGISIIAKISEILGPVYILGIVVIALIAIPSANIHALEPQLEQGFYPMIVTSPFVLSFYGICIMMAMFIPQCDRPENGFLAKFIAVSLGAFFVGIVVILTTSVFGLTSAQNTYAPIYEITSTLYPGLDTLWLIIIVGAGIIASAMMMWAFSLGVSQIIGLSTYKTLIYPAAFIALALSLIFFQSNIKLMHYVEHTYPVIAIFVEGFLEILLFVLALTLKKRG